MEFKIKNGLVGDKKTYSIKSFNFNQGCGCRFMTEHLQSSDLPVSVKTKLKFLKPVVVNTYIRKYYVSFNKNYRITVDTNQWYSGVSGSSVLNKQFNTQDINTILEIKYDTKNDKRAASITNYFPFRVTKSSKYVNAVKYVYL